MISSKYAIRTSIKVLIIEILLFIIGIIKDTVITKIRIVI